MSDVNTQGVVCGRYFHLNLARVSSSPVHRGAETRGAEEKTPGGTAALRKCLGAATLHPTRAAHVSPGFLR